MNFDEIARRGLVLLGCGKMGSAMLGGWLAEGLAPTSVWVQDPKPSDWVQAQGVQVNAPLPSAPAVALIAVKPQVMSAALPELASAAASGTLFISVAAGIRIAAYEAMLGHNTSIIRAMPNTPAAVGQAITAIVGNDHVSAAHLTQSEQLLSAIGAVVRLEHEAQMDAVTGLSGSGPAYVFHLIEAMAAAGTAEGLAPDLAMRLAKATVAGAGALTMASDETPTTLRENVTSPNGTTQAGLAVLMDPATGLSPLIGATVSAATARSRELSDG